ncbi:MAG TPA: hypothetical protein VD927_16150, partial [Chryseosolibacter sp.]|nr:hypothetical protein [Chryseosolibacter sp.]
MFKLLLKRVILFAVFSIQGLLFVNAQTSAQEIATNLSNDPRVATFTMESSRGTPSLIKMNETGSTLPLTETSTFLQSVLGYGQETSFVVEATTHTNGVRVDKFQQYTNGIKVEHGVFKAMSQKGIVLGFTAEYYSLPPSISSS